MAFISPTRQLTLSIIVANYNARDLLAGCLESIYRNPPGHPFEVFVVDDASSDCSVEMVEARFPQVYLLHNEKNVHYARSNNRVLPIARGRYVYLLNNDTLVLPGALDAMIDFLDQYQSVGAVGSKLLNGDGTIQASVRTLPNRMSPLFSARSIMTRLFRWNRFSHRHLLHLWRDMTRPFPAGYVSSASIMIRREVVAQVGLLDERLSYHVDADYCKRVWDAGWKVYYLPVAAVIHFDHKGGTMVSRSRRFKSVIERHRGSYIYFRKHSIKSPWHPLHFLAVAGLSARFLVSLAFFTGKEIVALARAGARRGPIRAHPDRYMRRL
jgi:GT2 family glycosyltransferase